MEISLENLYMDTGALRLRSVHNHVLSKKTSCLYQIRCLTHLKEASILRIYLSMHSFITRHIPDRQSRVQIGFDQILPFIIIIIIIIIY